MANGMINVKLSSSSSLYGSSSLNQTPVKDGSGIIMMQNSFNNNNVASNMAQRYDPELEKSLPGVLIANGDDSSAFDMLYRLEDLAEPKITDGVRKILKLIPTNPRLLDAYDRIISNNEMKGGQAAMQMRMMSRNVSSASVAAAASNNAMNVSMVKSPSVSSMINCTGILV